jgi:hypothetical protein
MNLNRNTNMLILEDKFSITVVIEANLSIYIRTFQTLVFFFFFHTKYLKPPDDGFL